ncbi:MAG: FAD-dependent monooxygenase [Pseudomonadota bacterium]
MTNKPNVDVDVLVIGGGPVGLSLAGDIGWRGLRALLVEQTDGVIVQPKMDGVNVRTMEFCRRWGITGNVRNCGYPKEYPQDMVYLTSFNGYELGREEFATPSGGSEDARPGISPETRFRCPQNLFDPILIQFARSQPTTELRYRTRLVSFDADVDSVNAVIEDCDSGARKEVRARYLVGCDGAASTVRKQLAIPMSGLGTLTYSTNVLFRCAELREKASVRLGYRYLFIGREGTWATVVAIDGGDIWRLSIIGTAEKVDYTEADVRAAIERVIGRPMAFSILSIVPWVRRELVADRFRSGPVFIAGDAAHTTSPTGGFGMNIGIADAVDLSWKIEGVLQGWAGESLLDSYEIERRPVALRAVREASGNLRRTLSPGPNPRLLDESFDGALQRYEVGKRFSATMLREWYKQGIDLGYEYEGSPVVIPDAATDDFRTAPPPDSGTTPPDGYLSDGQRVTPTMLREWQRLGTHVALGQKLDLPWEEIPAQQVMLYKQSSRPGARAPHVRLEDGSSTLDWFGRGFVIVHAAGSAEEANNFAVAARALEIPLQLRASELPVVRELYIAPLVLVRPDGHVAWRGSTADMASAQAILRRVTGIASGEAA